MTRNLLVAGACAIALTACSKPPAAPAVEAKADPATGVGSDGTQYAVKARSDGATRGFQAAADGARTPTPSSETDAEYRRLLSLLKNPIGISAIIGNDDRSRIFNTRVHPESAQVLVVFPNGFCSGSMVGPDLVLTAGQCVHTGGAGGQWAKSAVVYPGRNGAASPFGACRARKFYSVLGWTRDKDRNYDIGAIKLDCRVGESTGWMGFFWQTASLVGMSARISGYGEDKGLQQWTHTDLVRSNTPTTTTYFTDTKPGNSGSGVFTPNGFAGCGPCIHTVHAYGSTAGNSGTRITRPLFDNLIAWRAEP